MQDFIPLGTGNSRYLKSVENFKMLYPTYDAFVAALVAGTLPIDLNGINEAGVSQKGTPLNKANLLTDETVALFGLGADAVPNDALAWVGKYNLHWWKRRARTYEPILAGSTSTVTLLSTSDEDTTETIKYAERLSLDSGKIGFAEPINAVTCSYSNADAANVVAGKYVRVKNNLGTSYEYYYVAPSATVSTSSGWNSYKVAIKGSLVEDVNSIYGEWEFVQSSDSDAYPHDGVGGGFEYKYLGVPFENVVNPTKFEHGTYVGTNSSPASLTFSGTPLVVFVSVKVSANNYMWGAVGQQSGISIGSTSSNSIHLSTFSAELDGNTLTWGDESYNTEKSGSSWSTDTSGASYHELLNSSSNTYHYCALTV